VFIRKADAERHLTGVEHSKLVGAYVDPGKGRTTVVEYLVSVVGAPAMARIVEAVGHEPVQQPRAAGVRRPAAEQRAAW
jgi:hypothetical protein